MRSFSYAFSVHHFISSVGADAGFAAIIGLAILVLLYFAQARETASLREQAYQSAQRVQQLEARLAQLSRLRAEPGPAAPQPAGSPRPAPAPPGFARPVASPVTAAAGVTAPSPVAVPASIPAAPAGVAAPALTAATRLIPMPARAPADAVTPAPPPVAAPAATVTSAPRPAAATVAAQRSLAHPELGSPVPVGANGAGAETRDNGTGDIPAAPVAVQPPPRAQIRPDAGGPAGRRPSGPPRGTLAQPARRRGPVRIVAAVLAALAVGGAVALLLLVTSSGGKQQPASSRASSTNAALTGHRTQPVAFKPASVTVAVLNGTPTAGLAAGFSHQLGRDGYRLGATTNAADQTHTSTIVAYVDGQKTAALHVASSLGLSATAVQPIDQVTQAIACPPPSACADLVVVTLGSDLASRA